VPAGLKITLTPEEDQTLKELELADRVPRRTKQRATALRLNSKGWKVKAIASYLKCASSTVRQTIHRWQDRGLRGLWEAQGRGRKATWSDEDWQAISTWLSEERSYSARQLSQKLATERQVRLGAEQMRRILLKKNGVGKG
jgi:transposase